MTKAKTPNKCHLWNNKNLTKEELYNSLKVIKVYDDDPHQTRSLKKCKQCGQLYFYEFKEFIDWDKGNDAQYQTYIPVEKEEDAAQIANESEFQLLRYPSIRINFPSDAKKPSKPYYSNLNKYPKEDSSNKKDDCA